MTPEEQKFHLQKKEAILLILENLRGSWEHAEACILLLQSSYATEEVVNEVSNLFVQGIEQVKTAEAKEKLQSARASLERIKQIEMEEGDMEKKLAELALMKKLLLA